MAAGSRHSVGRTYRFGPYELDPAGELRKFGVRIRLQNKPLLLLLALVERPGEIVSRSQLQERLWPDINVDFDKNLNIAVKKVRDALCDDAEAPKYVETIPGKGYRLLVPVTRVEEAEAAAIEPEVKVAAQQRYGWQSVRWALIAVLVVSALGWGGWKLRQSRLKFEPHDYVLIADFENRTGEPVLDGVIETALRRELSNSPYVSVASPQRVNDALKMMRKLSSSRLDGDIAREVCLRDGAIKAILTGRLQKIGATYEIDIFIVNPSDGRTVSAVSETAERESELYRSMRVAADAVRRRLGESASDVRASGAKLERVTTPSLQALQLYSQGERAAEEDRWPEAEQLFRRALVSDPQFASAINMLAWSLRHQPAKNKRQDWLDLSETANQLADSVSDHEANFIRGTYFVFRGQHDSAIAAFKAVLDVYPDDPWCAFNVWAIELSRGNDAAANMWAQRMSDARPNDPSMTFRAWAAAANRGEISAAKRYANRLKKLDDAGILPASMKVILAWQPALEKAGSGDLAGAMKAVQQMISDVEGGRLQQKAFVGQAIFFFPAIGKLDEAERWASITAQEREVPEFAQEAIATRAGDGGKKLIGATETIRLKYPNNTNAAIFAATDLAHTGRCADMLAAIRRIPGGVTGNWSDWMRGEIERCQGKFDAAATRLKDAIRHAEASGDRSGMFFESESLARVLDAQGKTEAAIAVLEPLERDPRFDLRQATGPTEARFFLSTLYRKAGRISEAKKVEAELFSLLSAADPDFPLLVALRNRRDGVDSQ